MYCLFNSMLKKRVNKGGDIVDRIVILSGSPLEDSRTDYVLKYLGDLLSGKGVIIQHISVRDVPPADLVYCDFGSPVIQDITQSIQKADGVIVGSPVYKAAYAGVLKSLIDLMPQDVLEGKPVLPLMTGGTKSHLLALEYTLKPLLATLKGHTLKGIYLVDSEISREHKQPVLDLTTHERMLKQVDYFTEFVGKITGRSYQQKS